ncbi:hypothetical protein WIS52_18005 [Pseudonocardia nematodicida]|uniref:Asp23/Gls24 family envelope stress response protein n=1 Tax=Pseudonocardia nematodicida TaxID=1206997 RepID=A0ABV1KD31_9PSEU
MNAPAPGTDTAAVTGTRPADPGDRGALDIDTAVLRKIVEFAANGASAARHRVRSVAGVGVGDSGPRARVTPRSDADVDVRLRITLAYPGPVRAAVADIRERVAGDLWRMTGYRIREFSVEVDALQSARQSDRAHAASTARVS